MLRGLVRSIAAGSVAAAMIACGGSSGSTTGPTPVFTSVVVSPASPSVDIGSTTTLSAVAQDQNGATLSGAPAATWSSSDETKATVNASGVVTGVAAGTATITASITDGSITHAGTRQVIVLTPSSTGAVTASTSLAFNPSTVNITPAGGTGSVTWTFQSVAHTVTWDSQPSGAAVTDIPATAGANVSRNFTVAGTYTYHCSIHSNMNGTVIVH